MNEPHVDPDLPLSPALDAWLAARPVSPSADFAERVLADVAQESPDDLPEACEDWLADWPVEAAPDFADEVLARLDEPARKVIAFPGWTPLVGLAAALALAVGAAFSLGPRPAEAGPDVAARVAAPLDAGVEASATAPLQVASDAATDPAAVEAELAAFEEMLLLSELLAGADFIVESYGSGEVRIQ